MSRIATFKLEIPCDDDVKFDALKPIIVAQLRALGAKPMAAEAVEGTILAVGDTTAHFSAATVKTFQSSPRVKTKAGAVNG